MNIKRFLGKHLLLSRADKSILENEVRHTNLQRILVLSFLILPVSAAHVLLFKAQLNEGTPTEYRWKMGIIYAHSTFFLLVLVIAGLTYYLKKKDLSKTKLAKAIIGTVFLLMPCFGAALTAIDQLVNASINAFLITCIAPALILQIRPMVALVLYLVSYGAFFVSLGYYQPDDALLLTMRVNGISATGIGIGLAWVLWRTNMMNYRQSRQILAQQTALEKNNAQLQLSTQHLADANSAKDKLFAIVSHDLRGPLQSTLQLSKMMVDNTAGDSEESRQRLSLLQYKSLQNTSRLLENLLLWARSQTNQIPFKPAVLDVHQTVKETLGYLQSMASGKNISLQNQVKPQVLAFADKEMVGTIFRNLISNAIKFTRLGGQIDILVESTGPSEEGVPSILVKVQDNGVGIAEKSLAYLFDISKKTTSLGTQNEAGSGLGLILCKEFVEKNGGTLGVESEKGKGTCISFTLPLASKEQLHALEKANNQNLLKGMSSN
ncbi:sensor histidine kinase [Sabulibacter ruber]|uniref:sensor histidine kinase n=1 Tax=Sabulibacter ruber TaxID=2811901 RepID=UPI001A960BC3|nr:HAMP domain-containing sensor histidine kinase [Sabulibacter ruber]